jgi:ABC-type antimicrobial peptide transport system permease subunit
MSNPSPYFALRAESDPIGLVSTIRAVVRKFDPGATVDNVATMEHVVSNSISRPRLQAVLLGVFAGLAGALAIIGTYGVIAYSVAQRTREIGIRMARGATRANVMRLVLRQSVALIGLGLVLGLTSAAAVTRYLQGMLFGLTPLDPTTLIGVALMFGVVATLASGVPGRRATKVDPIVALRWE